MAKRRTKRTAKRAVKRTAKKATRRKGGKRKQARNKLGQFAKKRR